MVRIALVVAIALSGVACHGSESEPVHPISCPLGDPAAAPEIEIVSRDMNGAVSRTSTGSQVPLFQPPQGGWVVLVGVRAKNVDGCNLSLTGSLRDPSTNKIVGLEQRPVHLVPSDDGWGDPAQPQNLDNFANIAGCPNAGLSRDLYNQEYELKLEIQDRNGKMATSMCLVTIVCGDPTHARLCECQCKPDYVLGDPC